jgi:hypothetical protein
MIKSTYGCIIIINPASMTEKRNANKVLVRKPEGISSLARTTPRHEGDIKMDLKITLCECVGWIHLA